MIECNWLQALEVGIDPAHASYLHRFFEDESARPTPTASSSACNTMGADMPMTKILRDFGRPRIEVETDRVWPADRRAAPAQRQPRLHIRITNMAFPHAFVIPMSKRDDHHAVARAGR